MHFDVYAPAIQPLIGLGATVHAEYLPTRVTLSDPEGNEFCAFLTDTVGDPPARVFAVCTDSDQPEGLTAWWAAQVGGVLGPGPDGRPRYLHEPTGWPGMIWKFVRVDGPRVTPNRWRWASSAQGDDLARASVPAGRTVAADPQGNEFEEVTAS